MAESLRGAPHRLNPTRVPQSCSRCRGATSAPHPDRLLRLLSPGSHAPLARQAMHPMSGPSSSPRLAESCSFRKSAACTTATCARPRRRTPPGRRPGTNAAHPSSASADGSPSLKALYGIQRGKYPITSLLPSSPRGDLSLLLIAATEQRSSDSDDLLARDRIRRRRR